MSLSLQGSVDAGVDGSGQPNVGLRGRGAVCADGSGQPHADLRGRVAVCCHQVFCWEFPLNKIISHECYDSGLGISFSLMVNATDYDARNAGSIPAYCRIFLQNAVSDVKI